jgi:hypothetical protein
MHRRMIIAKSQLVRIAPPTTPNAPVAQQKERMMLSSADCDNFPVSTQLLWMERIDLCRNGNDSFLPCFLCADSRLAIVVESPCEDDALFINGKTMIVPGADVDDFS